MTSTITIKKILETANFYLNKKKQKVIVEAYNEAKKIHKKEKRVSGEPYITHPLKVAYYITQEKLDEKAIAAALLHDVVENSSRSIQYIERKFGTEIAMLVDGLTKLNKVKIKSKWTISELLINKITGKDRLMFEQHVDNLRKMVLAMTKDIRIILIKLADRLHNMQTIKYLPKEKRFEIAQQTLEIYAPIAYRLGMGELKGTLEDLSFPYVYPKEYKKIKKISAKYYPQQENYIDQAKIIIAQEIKKNKINAEINGRKKHLYSLWKKLNNYNGDINKIYDLIALRIVVNSIEDCYKVLGIIHKKYKPLIGRIKDYIAVAKSNGYRSLHTTVFGPYGKILEIQIRDWEMHEQAEFGIAAHWHYSTNKNYLKLKKTIHIPRLQVEWLKELALWHEKITDPEEWTNGLKMDFFKDHIYVYTPKGDVINLPNDSTPIDFAYSVHSEIGNSCIGAKINGKICKINTKLMNGDIVQIITNPKNQKPKKDWLKFVKSHKAKDYIKSFFNKS